MVKDTSPGALLDEALGKVDAERQRLQTRLETTDQEIADLEAKLQHKRQQRAEVVTAIASIDRDRTRAAQRALASAGIRLVQPKQRRSRPAPAAAGASGGDNQAFVVRYLEDHPGANASDVKKAAAAAGLNAASVGQTVRRLIKDGQLSEQRVAGRKRNLPLKTV